MNTISKSKVSKVRMAMYWIFTSLVFLLDSALPAFTFNTDSAKQVISHYGYPDYFRIELSIGKIIGGILLILPMIPARFKEWAYVGFGIDFISAVLAICAVDGFGGPALFPLAMFIILIVSYVYYHKIKNLQS